MDIEKGDSVKYIPRHAKGDEDHEDCEVGIVSSINSYGTIFVKYGEEYTAKSTRIEALVLLS